MTYIIIYIVIGQLYGYRVHVKYPYPKDTPEKKFVVEFMEHIFIPLFFPVFMIKELISKL